MTYRRIDATQAIIRRGTALTSLDRNYLVNDSPLELKKVTRAFGATPVFEGLSLAVAEGEFIALVGPSGIGKTTLLNVLSGHDQPTVGEVIRRRRVRMVYQQDGLFPWLTARENISMGLNGEPNERTRELQLEDLLALIGMSDFGHHFPHQLSRGMRQRVELARALAGESDILMMDEPFSALDYITRLRLRAELVRILGERPRTVVLVTHDIEEAAQLADRVLVLNGKPARIQAELAIELPRPRPVTHPLVVSAIERILTELGLKA
jgi:NitT/TauT family transport system ATP-binding protein